MLNKSGKSGHLCLIHDFGENVFSFLPLRIMFVVGLSYMAFIMLRDIPSMLTFWRVFYHKYVLNFIKSLFCIYWDDHMVFILQFVNMVYHHDWLAHTEEFLHPWDKSSLIYLKGEVLQLLWYFGSSAIGWIIIDSWRVSCPQGEQQPVLISFSPLVPLVLGLPWWLRQ